MALAAAVMAGALWAAMRWLEPNLASAAPFYEQAAALGVMIAGAMLIYFALVLATGGADIATIRRSVRRGTPPPAPDA